MALSSTLPRPEGSPQSGGLGRALRGSNALTVVCCIGAYLLGGPSALAVVVVLALIEAMLSAASALFSGTLLRRLSRTWQRIYLTAGLLGATIGVRFLLPLAIVCATAHLSPAFAVHLLAYDPDRFLSLERSASPAIGMFVGIFLLILFLEFAFTERQVMWWPSFERLLQRVGRTPSAAYIIAVACCAVFPANVPAMDTEDVAVAGCAAIAARLIVRAITTRVSERVQAARTEPDLGGALTGRSALGMLCYVELLNAAVSLDSVAVSFSVTLNAALIGLGLLIGASYVRSMTIYAVRAERSADQFVYLEHGKYYAVGIISILTLWTVWRSVPDVITRSSGIIIITFAFLSSVWRAISQRLQLQRAGGHPGVTAYLARARASALERRRLVATHSASATSAALRDRQEAGFSPLFIYLENGSEHAEIEREVAVWVAGAGLEIEGRLPPVSGSWLTILWAGLQAAADAADTAHKSERPDPSIEPEAGVLVNAEIAAALVATATQALSTLSRSRQAVVYLVPVLVVRANGTTIVATLSEAQQDILKQQPQLLCSPRTVLSHLNTPAAGSLASAPHARSGASTQFRKTVACSAPFGGGAVAFWFWYGVYGWPADRAPDRLAVGLAFATTVAGVAFLPLWEWAKREGSDERNTRNSDNHPPATETLRAHREQADADAAIAEG